ncbi:cell wall hydrolase P75 [Lacticaseibacillus chiayiensis]|uniref:cell wall hydrolase P75 n=1 Tax=Lacticaseibacillus chiayiensis TaxID=2100821 RepID=UPI00101114EE|nr:cell wall hydrolase P75 [Lacticaseibacillus chiayiensis]RXT58050.1 glycoside hydrolase [Lacticaseibacillus chiayiensis]
MVKSKKVWSVTAGFVGAAGLAALATGANTVSASTTGTVNYKTGATTVWNSPSWNHVKRYVTFGDTVQLLGKTVDHNGATWYKIGDNQWIPEIYLNVDGKSAQVQAPASTASSSQAHASQAPASQAPASQAPASQATTATSPATTQSANIQLYVKNVGSAVTVWATPAYGHATGQYLEGRQSVTAAAQQQVNGETWYQLANGGYVPSRFVSTTPVAATPQSTAPKSTASSAAAPASSAAPQAPASSSAAQPSQAPSSPAPVSSAAPSSQASQASQAPASSSAAQPSQAPAAPAPAASSAAPESEASATPAPASSTTVQTTQLSQQQNNNVAEAAYTAPVAQTQTQTQTQTPTVTSTSRQAKVQAVISIAEQQIGKPYVWGGKGPNSFDCSGLMYYAFLHGAGVNIGGWTVPQESSGQQVSLSALQPGDLLFWGGHGATYHVALYIGGGTMIQAPQPGENVKYTALNYFMPDFAVRPNL